MRLTRLTCSICYVIITASLAVTIVACATSGSKTIPPSPPTFVPKSRDTAAVEMGIRPVPGSNAIYMEWFKAVGKVAGYVIYRTSQTQDNILDGTPINFIELIDLPVGSRSGVADTVYSDTTTALNTRYYYRLQSYVLDNNHAKVFGTYSDTANFKLLSHPTNLSSTIIGQNVSLNWNLQSGGGGKYVVRVYEQAGNGQAMWISKPIQRYDLPTSCLYNADSTAKPLVVGTAYKWRVDFPQSMYLTIPVTLQGGSSDWSYFTR
jgi:hypothetical protein